MADKRHSIQANECEACGELLENVHPHLVFWFQSKVKPKYPSVHVELGYRDMEQQAEAARNCVSRFQFPESPHNARDPIELLPESRAIDLFFLEGDQAKAYPMEKFLGIAEKCIDSSVSIAVGVECKERNAFNHFELSPRKPVAAK